MRAKIDVTTESLFINEEQSQVHSRTKTEVWIDSYSVSIIAREVFRQLVFRCGDAVPTTISVGNYQIKVEERGHTIVTDFKVSMRSDHKNLLLLRSVDAFVRRWNMTRNGVQSLREIIKLET